MAGQAAIRILVYHAEGAGDCPALLVYAPAAARQSAMAGAHPAAEALLRAALPCAASAPLAERAALLEAHAVECMHLADAAGAIASRRKLVALWREPGEPDRRRFATLDRDENGDLGEEDHN